MRSLREVIEQPLDRDVFLLIRDVRAGLDLRLDLGDLVDADVVVLQRLEQVADAGQLELVGARAARRRRRRVGGNLLADGLLCDLLNGRVAPQTVDGRTHVRVPRDCSWLTSAG